MLTKTSPNRFFNVRCILSFTGISLGSLCWSSILCITSLTLGNWSQYFRFSASCSMVSNILPPNDPTASS